MPQVSILAHALVGFSVIFTPESVRPQNYLLGLPARFSLSACRLFYDAKTHAWILIQGSKVTALLLIALRHKLKRFPESGSFAVQMTALLFCVCSLFNLLSRFTWRLLWLFLVGFSLVSVLYSVDEMIHFISSCLYLGRWAFLQTLLISLSIYTPFTPVFERISSL